MRRSAAPIVVYSVLIALSLAVYAPSFDNGFRDDDFAFLQRAATASGFGDLIRPGAGFAFFRPGAWLLFAGEYKAFGLHGGLYLAFNWLLHLLNSLLLLAVLRRMRFGPDASAWAAGLFVLGYGHYGKQVMWACSSGPLLAVALVLCVTLLALAGRGARRLAPLAGLVALAAPAFHELGLVAVGIVFFFWLDTRRREGGAPKATLVWVATAAVVWSCVLIAVAPSHATYAHGARTIVLTPLLLVRYIGLMALPLQPPAAAAGGVLGAVAPVAQLLLGLVVLWGAWRLARAQGRPAWVLCAWGLLALAPFSLVGMPGGWMELRYLYFSATAFDTLVAIWLLRRSPRARSAIVPLLALVTAVTTLTLEHKYDAMAASDRNQNRLEQLQR